MDFLTEGGANPQLPTQPKNLYTVQTADTHFASQIILPLGTFYFKVAWYTLILNTFYSSAHFAPRNTFLLSTLCFMEHFAS